MIFFVVFACESERGGRRVSDTRTRPVQAAASATRLLVEDGLGLTAEAHLFVIVSALALREVRRLARLVLRDLVRRVLAALLALAEGPPELGEVDLTSERANKAAAQGEPESNGDGGGGDGTK